MLHGPNEGLHGPKQGCLGLNRAAWAQYRDVYCLVQIQCSKDQIQCFMGLNRAALAIYSPVRTKYSAALKKISNDNKFK